MDSPDGIADIQAALQSLSTKQISPTRGAHRATLDTLRKSIVSGPGLAHNTIKINKSRAKKAKKDADDARRDARRDADSEEDDSGTDDEGYQSETESVEEDYEHLMSDQDSGALQGAEMQAGTIVLQNGNSPVVHNGVQMSFADYLNSLSPHIVSVFIHDARNSADTSIQSSLHRPQPILQPPEMCKSLHPHQLIALRAIRTQSKTTSRALILGDEMGVGKTAVGMASLLPYRNIPDGVCIVVAPVSTHAQWRNGFKTFFKKRTFKVQVLNDSETSRSQVLEADVVIMSYDFMRNQYTAAKKYRKAIAAFEDKGYAPKNIIRPNLILFDESAQLNIPCLILDEAHNIRNPTSYSWHAAMTLRKRATFALLLTGTMFPNRYTDVYAVLRMVRGHPFTDEKVFKSHFTAKDSHGKEQPPDAGQIAALTHIIKWCTLARPAAVIPLPSLDRRLVTFRLDDELAAEVQEAFKNYEIAVAKHNAKKKKSKKRARQGPGGKKKVIPGFSILNEALQSTHHPTLAGIAKQMDDARKGNAASLESEDTIPRSAQDVYNMWLDGLRGGGWHSPRVDKILTEYGRFVDIRPDGNVLIFSESVFFQDILEIALQESDFKVECLRFNGRQTIAQREEVLEEFARANGTRPLLISMGAGAEGLNLAFANMVILTEIFWCAAKELQAIARAHRQGQQYMVEVVQVTPQNSFADDKKQRTNNAKSEQNMKLHAGIVKLDSDQVVIPVFQ